MTNLAFHLTIALLSALLGSAEGGRKSSGGVSINVFETEDDDGGVPIGLIIGGASFGLCIVCTLLKLCAPSDTPDRAADSTPKLNLNDLPFCFVPGVAPGRPHRAVCKLHKMELCKGCKCDYTLMNRLSVSPGFQAAKEKDAKINFTKTFVLNYFRSLPKEVMPGGSNFGGIPVDKVVSDWESRAEKEDPGKVVHAFAGICYVKRSLPLSVELTNAATQRMQLLRALTLAHTQALAQAQTPPPPHGAQQAPRTVAAPLMLSASPRTNIRVAHGAPAIYANTKGGNNYQRERNAMRFLEQAAKERRAALANTEKKDNTGKADDEESQA